MVWYNSYNSETVDRPALFDIVMFSITKQEINLKYHRFFWVLIEKKEDKQLIGSSVGLKEVLRYQEKTQLWMPHNTNMNEFYS